MQFLKTRRCNEPRLASLQFQWQNPTPILILSIDLLQPVFLSESLFEVLRADLPSGGLEFEV